MILMSSAKVEIKLETTKKNVGNYTFPTIFMSVSTFFQSKMPLNLTLLPFTATSVFSVLSVPEGNSLFTLHSSLNHLLSVLDVQAASSFLQVELVAEGDAEECLLINQMDNFIVEPFDAILLHQLHRTLRTEKHVIRTE